MQKLTIIVFKLIIVLMSQNYFSQTCWAMRVRIAGSNSMYPLMTAVAERFTYETGKPSPIVEATGTGGGIKIFCSGIGARYPDLVAASRPMSQTEREFCAKNGIDMVHEIQFGFDGIVLAQFIDNPHFMITVSQLNLALKQTADRPQRWSDIDASMLSVPIQVYGPPTTSGTREALEALLSQGQKDFSIRDDGVYIETPDEEGVVARKINIERRAVGVFSYGFFMKNHDQLRALVVNGVRPHYRAIVNGQYPLSRRLYIYVKKCKPVVYSILTDFVKVLLDPLTSGPEGYLRAYGFIALPAAEHREMQKNTLQFLKTFDMLQQSK